MWQQLREAADGLRYVEADKAANPSECEPLLPSPGSSTSNSSPSLCRSQTTSYRTYHRRWLILFTFSMSSMLQCSAYSLFGPIADSVKCAFNWSDGTLSMLPGISNWVYVLTAYVLSMLMERQGLRAACLLAAFAQALGISLWLVDVGDRMNTVFMYAGMVGVSISSPIVCSAPPLLSAVWFPPEQRTTSTALATYANNLGYAVSFLMGPKLVQQLGCNRTNASNVNDVGLADFQLQPLPSPASQQHEASWFKLEQRRQIHNYVLADFGWAVIILLLTLFYFPEVPPTPPSVSACEKRSEFWPSLLRLLRNRSFWIFSFSFGFWNGTYQGWLSIVQPLLQPLNISQEEAGWMGCFSVIAGVLFGLVTSRVADIWPRRHQLFIAVLAVLYIVVGVWMILLVERVLPPNRVQLWAAVILISVFAMGASPLYYELGCEVTYPIGESVPCAQLTTLQAFFAGIYLAIPVFGDASSTLEVCRAMNVGLVASALVGLLLLIGHRPQYRRLCVDDKIYIAIPQAYSQNNIN